VVSRARAARAVTSLALAALATMAVAQPGRVVALEEREKFSAAQVDAQSGARFRNDGSDAPTPATAVTSYVLRFETRALDGRPAEALAHLFVPRETGDAGMLLAFAPGSTGLVDACAPSAGYIDGGRLDTYGAYGLAYAAQGVPTVVPNYLGFFDPEVRQPYFVAEAEAMVVLDALRAAGAALEQLDRALTPTSAFVAGYSQGGHAAFATADRAADLAPDVPLAGVVGFGPSGQVDVTLRAFPYVAGWILVAYDETYPGRIDPAALMASPFDARLAADADRLCIAGVQSYYPGSPEGVLDAALARSLREGTLERTHPELAALIAANDTGIVAHGLPVIILQGVDDPVAPFEDQNRYVLRLCELGVPVRYPNYLRTRHETRYVGFAEALAWMRARAAAEPPPDDCDIVPRP
jgi:pimeloyl-ACP methyl ester carboxylesterase